MQYFKAVYSLYKAAKTTTGFTKSLEEWIKREGLEGTDWRIEPGSVEIKAVACWETVGALGVPENWVTRMWGKDEKWKFLDTQLPERECSFPFGPFSHIDIIHSVELSMYMGIEIWTF